MSLYNDMRPATFDEMFGQDEANKYMEKNNIPKKDNTKILIEIN